jgi:hypothetical protein
MRLLVLAAIALAISCNDLKYYYYQPANPPSGLELSKLANGDYLLIFYSENRNNQRFGGFMIFINASKDALLDMESIAEASYLLEGNSYNLGIDTPVAILFSDAGIYDSVINGYTITGKVTKGNLVTNSWMTLRAYLHDDNNEILDTSFPGNPVLIEP